MIQFLYHDGIQKEIAALGRRFHNIDDGLSAFERLCEKQFHPTNPQPAIGPGKLHRISQNDIWTLWKIELIVPNSGLRPNQFPRMWFVVKGAIIAFLCITSHIDNYNDNEMNLLALSRVSDLF
ncbi:MAG: hypothetical protein A3C70_00760 [Candidatus Zambryskibacteria bacterium RIFCSPHIGHO2_02_FULL_43_14]|uniref:Uncharacterized protein n=1 Tax=Candidatus Zambryskibacteria bacterium RIFCSPHIGHO2_02_FULL_43_14 TaxID=1802748 RepID=A0A1G2TE19_9BACT|nr:MAG: hypothetical protein A2829_02805 [Candidatus Zambryskibacteria bacterium RIFCSPHIGHO2_01_FULL_43_60]OHA95544.1 MAG: hypothetical protein A3C70_00760 [Candidatus Zambryskibacteria bacterium RIFCSPHIGHO2_02_FULL_43_14]OHB02898.1 MAG: hypothetical protein A3B03_03200 [Candidatus Zambryskibacteria bacterium RIFCSPLOWO2_01_FULL_42_41]